MAAAKVHKSLRLDGELVGRVDALRNEGEPLSNAMARVMAVGCDALEGVSRESTSEHAGTRDGSTEAGGESTRKLVSLLERENERLAAEHENDLKRLEEKDALIAKALENAHDLADQAQIIAGMAHEARQLPAADEGGDVLDVGPLPKRITFREWWSKYRKGL